MVYICIQKRNAMADVKFYIQRYARNAETGVWGKDGSERSLEDDFGFCRYKSLSNVNAYGKPKSVYTETYAESNSARVWFGERATREQVSHELVVYFFGSSPESPITKSVAEQVSVMEAGWHKLYGFLENGLLVWHDTIRQRKILFEIADAPTISNDVVKGTPYLQVTIKLSNIFGQTFDMDDTTIEDWLASGGKEVV